MPEGYLEPKSTAERVANEAASTLGGLLFPLTGGTKVKAGKALAEAVGGDVAKFMGHYLTGSEEVGEKAKIGTMLAVSLGLAVAVDVGSATVKGQGGTRTGEKRLTVLSCDGLADGLAGFGGAGGHRSVLWGSCVPVHIPQLRPPGR